MQKRDTAKGTQAPVEVPQAIEQDFLFPTYGKVIKATSLAEAEKKLQEILKKENN